MADQLPEAVIVGEQILGQSDHHLPSNGPLGARDEAYPQGGQPGREQGSPSMRGCGSPMTRAVSSRISFPESATGPGISKHALCASGNSMARTRAITTSSI